MRYKIDLSIIFIITIVFSSNSFVFSEGIGSVEINLKAAKNSYALGEEIVVSAVLENMQGEFCKDGVSSIGTYYLEYDNDILKVKSSEKLVDNTYLYLKDDYEPGVIQFKYVDISDEQNKYLSNNTELFRITFEILSNAEYGRTFITNDTTVGTIGDANAHLKQATTNDLEINIQDTVSSSAKLSKFFVDNYSITPSFNPNTNSYTLIVSNSTSSIKLNYEAGENNTISVASDKDSEIVNSIVDLEVGTNIITITVTNSVTQDENIYILTVNRNRQTGGSSPSGSGAGSINPSNNNSVENNTVIINVSKDQNNQVSAKVDEDKITQAITNANKEAQSSGEGIQVKININTIADISNSTVIINKKSIEKLETANVKSLTIENPIANISLDMDAIKAVNKNTTDNLSVSVGKVNNNALSEDIKAKIGTAPVYEFNIKAGEKNISDFDGGVITITIPYALKIDDDKDSLAIYHINDTGILEKMNDVQYDDINKTVTFKTKHFSKFTIMIEKIKTEPMFSDIANHMWAKEAIETLAKEGIIRGTSKDTFNPEDNITRADFILLLTRMFNISGTASDNFEDVTSDKYYYNSIGLAKELGLTTGVGGNKFDPESFITRQDMFVMAHRILEQKGLNLSKKADTTIYSDAKDISNYARNAIELFVGEEIIQGAQGLLNPVANATRAETAVFIYRLYNRR